MNDKSQGLLPAKRLKIALGDLRHSTAGRHSAIMPIGIGYIASYLLTNSDQLPNLFLYEFNPYFP